MLRRCRFPWRRWGHPRRRSVLLVALLLALLPATAVAAEIATGDTIIISSPVNDDLYLFGSDVRIDADVGGDVTVVAARVRIFGNIGGSLYATSATVIVDGNVGGTVMALAATVTVRGDVGHALRAASSELRLEGANVTGDVVASTTLLRADRTSRVGGDLWLRASDVRAEADIGGAVRGGASEWRLGGRIEGPIDVRAGTLRFTDGAVVSQPVRYVSDHELLIDGGTTVTGQLSRVEPDHPSLADRVETTLLYVVVRYTWALSLGLFLLRFARGPIVAASEALRGRPWGALWRGSLVLLGVPALIFVLLVTVIGLPVALLVLVMFLFALYASQLVVGLVVGRALTSVLSRSQAPAGMTRSLVIGLLIVVVVRSLPIPSWYVFSSLLTAIAALGALAMAALDYRRPPAAA